MASTQVGIVRKVDGTITQVVNPNTDAALDLVPLKAGETMLKINRSVYVTYTSMVALATAQGLKVK